MGRTVAETIRHHTQEHLIHNNGLLFGQCVTAVGWVGGTIPELTEEDGIVELATADSSNSGIPVGAALAGRRPIYVIRYQGFMWYNAPSLVNYAAKSKEMWNVPCPVFVRSIGMDGGIGPVATGCHHSMVMRMPGMPVAAPMTPKEWESIWTHFLDHDDPIYCSEHRKSFDIDYEMHDQIHQKAKITLIGISSSRLSINKALKMIQHAGITCDTINVVWLKPFEISDNLKRSLSNTKLGLVIDSDYSICAAGQSIAYDLMHEFGCPVHAIGLEDRSAGFAPHLDNITPSPKTIYDKVKELVQ
tara:strand:- start:299 stop:1204 length:906 start_codon:yes stop_codon:yes gene_type:complete